MKIILNLKTAALALVAVCSLFVSNNAEAQSAPWQFCAYEGQTCFVSGEIDMAFGAGSAWTYVTGARVPGQFICRWQTFGGDPAPGFQKSCFIRASAPPPPPPPPPIRWTYCADEGGLCDIARPATVRYGAAGNYLYLYDQIRFVCTNQVFGGDPAPGIRKQCSYKF